MKITHIKISTAMRFRLESNDFSSLPLCLQEQCGEIEIGSVSFGLEGDDLWIVHCKRFSVLKLSELQRIELWYWTPAKGWGRISVGAGYRDDRQGAAMLGMFDKYSDGYLASAKSFIRDLQGVLGYLPKIKCYGADC